MECKITESLGLKTKTYYCKSISFIETRVEEAIMRTQGHQGRLLGPARSINLIHSAPEQAVLYCTVHCTVLYCTVLYCTVLYCTVLYLLYCTVLQRGVRGGGAGGGGRGGGGHLPASGLGPDLRPARCRQTRIHFRPLCL